MYTGTSRCGIEDAASKTNVSATEVTAESKKNNLIKPSVHSSMTVWSQNTKKESQAWQCTAVIPAMQKM
jgi:hypothetical protein